MILRTAIVKYLEYSQKHNQDEVRFLVGSMSTVLGWIYSTRKNGSQEESYCEQISQACVLNKML